jgi:hypothetical protein
VFIFLCEDVFKLKGKQPTKQDAYTTNLLISLLMRFPEVMTINYDVPKDCVKFTFMLGGSVEKTEFMRFKKLLSESLSAYQDLTGEDFVMKAKLVRSGNLTLLELSGCTTTLSLEAIQLVTGIVDSVFDDILFRDAETLDAVRDDELMRQEEIIEYLLSHSTGSKQESLIAFREAGKVYVYDK